MSKLNIFLLLRNGTVKFPPKPDEIDDMMVQHYLRQKVQCTWQCQTINIGRQWGLWSTKDTSPNPPVGTAVFRFQLVVLTSWMTQVHFGQQWCFILHDVQIMISVPSNPWFTITWYVVMKKSVIRYLQSSRKKQT